MMNSFISRSRYTLCLLVLHFVLQGCSSIIEKVDTYNEGLLNQTLGQHYSVVLNGVKGMQWGVHFDDIPLPDGGNILKFARQGNGWRRSSSTELDSVTIANRDELYELIYFRLNADGVIQDWARGKEKINRNCISAFIKDDGSTDYVGRMQLGQMIPALEMLAPTTCKGIGHLKTISEASVRTSKGEALASWYSSISPQKQDDFWSKAYNGEEPQQ